MSRQREKHPYYVVGSIGDRNAKKYDCEHPNTYSHGNSRLRRVSRLAEQLARYEYVKQKITDEPFGIFKLKFL